MTGITITREDRDENHGRYVAMVDGHEAELTYTRHDGDLVSADHTGVPDALSGRGVGSALVARMVQDARDEEFRIVPRCSFVAAQARKHPEWAHFFTRG